MEGRCCACFGSRLDEDGTRGIVWVWDDGRGKRDGGALRGWAKEAASNA